MKGSGRMMSAAACVLGAAAVCGAQERDKAGDAAGASGAAGALSASSAAGASSAASAASAASTAGAAAGHDSGGFFLRSVDEAFELRVRGQVQLRYAASLRNDDDGDGDGTSEDSFESGFETRRTKLFLDGHVRSKRLTYQVAGAFGRVTGEANLEYAWMAYRWESGLRVLAGQFKQPLLREWLVSSSLQLAAERTLVNEAFNGGYVQGVQLDRTLGPVKLTASFHDGSRSQSTEPGAEKVTTSQGLLTRAAGAGESDYGVTGRAEWLLGGEWGALRDFTSPAGAGLTAMAGAAVNFEGGGAGSSEFAAGDYRAVTWTADLSLEGDGWNGFAAVVGSHADYEDLTASLGGVAAGGDLATDDYGFVVQGGYVLPGTDWEVFARYEATLAEGSRPGSNPGGVFDAVTAGVNYYMYGHASKFTADVLVQLDRLNPLVGGRPASGTLGDDDETEVSLRLQWQLLF
ncbi:MAG: porin [Planctomycetota bacterium]|nr:porin [Planctomycetota bacterium]